MINNPSDDVQPVDSNVIEFPAGLIDKGGSRKLEYTKLNVRR